MILYAQGEYVETPHGIGRVIYVDSDGLHAIELLGPEPKTTPWYSASELKKIPTPTYKGE